jgi:hypothetical protein
MGGQPDKPEATPAPKGIQVPEYRKQTSPRGAHTPVLPVGILRIPKVPHPSLFLRVRIFAHPTQYLRRGPAFTLTSPALSSNIANS